MKLHIFILSSLFIISLPLQAEESSLWDDLMSFFSSGDNQGEECDETKKAEEIAEELRSEICPHSLMNALEKDEEGIALGLGALVNSIFIREEGAKNLSPDNRCRLPEHYPTDLKQDIEDNNVFTNANELESHLKTSKPFSDLNISSTSIADCAPHTFHIKINKTSKSTYKKTLPDDKHKILVAEYYHNLHKVRNGLDTKIANIAAIDSLIGNDMLKGVSCEQFRHLSDISKSQCEELKNCSTSSDESLEQSSKDTIIAMKTISAIDREIKNLKGPRARTLKQNIDQIKELEKQKRNIQNLYPWIAGRKFNKAYKKGKDYSEAEMAEIIKEQLSHTREKLKEKMDEQFQAVHCMKYNTDCGKVDFHSDYILGKTTPVEIDNTSGDKNQLTQLYMKNVQCRHDARDSKQATHTIMTDIALDIALIAATAGLGAAAITGKLAFRAGIQISKAQRLQNLGLIGVDAAFSVPHIQRAADSCEAGMNQLETLADQSAKSDNVCKNLPVRSKHTSDLRNCLLRYTLAALPIALPAGIVIARGVSQAVKKSGKGTPPTAPRDPTPTDPTPTPPETTPLLARPPQQAPPRPTAEAGATRTADEAATPPATRSADSAGTPSTPRASRPTTSPARTTDEVPALPASQAGRRAGQEAGETIPSSKPTTPSARSTEDVPALPAPRQPGVRTAGREADTPSSGGATPRRERTRPESREGPSNAQARPNSSTQTRSSSARRNRTSRSFQALKDPGNDAIARIRAIRGAINANKIMNKRGRNSIGDLLVQTRQTLKSTNSNLSDSKISQIIATELRTKGVNVKYSKGNYKIQNNEGVFIVNANNGKISKIATQRRTSSSSPSRQDLQPAGSASRPPTSAGRSGAVVLRSNNRSLVPSRVGGQQARNVNRGRPPSTRRQQAVSAGTRFARQMDSPRNRTIPRSIQAGVVAKNAAGITAAGLTGSSAAANSGEEDSSDVESDNSGNTDSSNNNDGNADRDNDREERERKKKKDDWDCSKYKGGNPKNRKEMICYYYARAEQLQEETKNIQQRTQAMNNFKNQVWLGVKENKVPPNFFTSIQRHVQQNKDVTSNYLNSFRLMYDISRIQEQYLTPNARNHLRQIIQETGQYMNSPNLDSYSHIRESVSILLNRLQLPLNTNNPFTT